MRTLRGQLHAVAIALVLAGLHSPLSSADSSNQNLTRIVLSDSLTLRMSDGEIYHVSAAAQVTKNGRKVHLVVNEKTVDRIIHFPDDPARLRHEDKGTEILANCDLVVVDRVHFSRNIAPRLPKQNRPPDSTKLYRHPMTCDVTVDGEKVGKLTFKKYLMTREDS